MATSLLVISNPTTLESIEPEVSLATKNEDCIELESLAVLIKPSNCLSIVYLL